MGVCSSNTTHNRFKRHKNDMKKNVTKGHLKVHKLSTFYTSNISTAKFRQKLYLKHNLPNDLGSLT